MNFYHPYMMSLSGAMGSPQNIQQQNQNFINQNSNTGSYQIPANNGILMQQLGMPMTPAPILTGVGTPPPPPPVATSPARRDAVSMAVPRQSVGLAEKLMRVGGAIVGGSAQGGLTAFNAGTAEYGNIMDQQRKLDAVYESDMAKRVAASAAAQEKAIGENQDAINQYQGVLFDLKKARGYLTNADGSTKDGLTGLFDGTLFAAVDNQTGDPRANGRLLLEKLKVDDALLRIGQTKGAISNKEMDLFLKPAPSITDDEQKWLDWISGKEQAAAAVLNRIQTNTKVDPKNRPSAGSFAQFSQTYNTPASGAAPAIGESTTFTSNGRQVQVKNVTPTQ